MSELLTNDDYKTWLVDLKTKIQQSQIKAAFAVNSQLIRLYWDLGRQIVEKQKTAKWGSGFIDQLSKDLKEEFPEMGGFSAVNLRRSRQFFMFYADNTIWAQPVPKLDSGVDSNAKQAVSDLQRPENREFTNQPQLMPELQSQLFQIPWGHHVLILQKIKNQPEAIFYVKETIENN